MRLFDSSSITKRVSLVFVASNALTLVVLLIAFSVLALFFSLRSFRQELEAVGSVLASTSRASIAFDDAETGRRLLSSLQSVPRVRFAMLTKSNGEVLADYRKDTEEEPLLLTGEIAPGFTWSMREAVLAVPVVLGAGQIGSMVLVSELTPLYYQVTYFLLIAFCVVLFVMVASTLFSFKLRAWVSQPVRDLKELAEDVTATKDFSRRLIVARDDELSVLMRTFNTMLDELQERDNSLRQARDRAEEANRAKSMFVASISHELRTPLHAILGMGAELAQTPLNEEQADLLATLNGSGQSLLAIINDILDFSKVEAGKLLLNPTPFDIREFIGQTIRMLRTASREKQIAIEYLVDPKVPQKITADSGRLGQVLVNLIGNAVKFTKNGGAVSVAVNLELGDPSRRTLHFCVKDNGIGIPEDHLDLIFEAFTQVRMRERTTAMKGTGLGLTISSKLVRLMGGDIWVKSVLGVGSEFHFIIEYAEAAAQVPGPERDVDAGPAVVKSVSGGNEYTVLVAEDQPVNQKLISRLLKAKGYNLILAATGKECVSAFQEHPVDLVLMDINMPEMDGIEATRQIRQYEVAVGGRVPIIAATASVAPEDMVNCFEAGMEDSLIKPFTAQQLYACLARWLPRSEKSPERHEKDLN